MAMRVDFLSLFPEMFSSVFAASILGRAREEGLIDVGCTDLRLFSEDKQNKVDDTPYGGGAGMVMRVDPVVRGIEALVGDEGGEPEGRVIALMSAAGRPFTQADAHRLASARHLILVCGRYEGIDDRIADYGDQEISIGDFVLTGGELAAMVVVDAVARLIPGVLGNSASSVDESHEQKRLEYPQYTRPLQFAGAGVPDILLSGDHPRIAAWRQAQSLQRTRARRPDLLQQQVLRSDELKILCGREPRSSRSPGRRKK